MQPRKRGGEEAEWVSLTGCWAAGVGAPPSAGDTTPLPRRVTTTPRPGLTHAATTGMRRGGEKAGLARKAFLRVFLPAS